MIDLGGHLRGHRLGVRIADIVWLSAFADIVWLSAFADIVWLSAFADVAKW